MTDPTPVTCILLLLFMGAVWFVLLQARNTARNTPPVWIPAGPPGTAQQISSSRISARAYDSGGHALPPVAGPSLIVLLAFLSTNFHALSFPS